MKIRGLLLLAALGILAAACDSKSKKVDVPVDLTDIANPTVRVNRVWSGSVSGGGKKLRLGLGLASAGDRLFAAGHDGDIAAFNLKNGRQIWRTKTDLPLAGGTGTNGSLVAVGSADGVIVALSADSGVELWRANVGGEVLSAPAVSESQIVVRTVSGRLHALAIADGKTLWEAEQNIPRLTLRGVSAPVVARDLAISGFDNGRVLAVNLEDGQTVWEAAVSPSKGRTELERLNDIDGAVKVVDNDVFVAGFQGRAGMLALDSGQVWWARDVSTYRGIDVDDEHLYVSTSSGELLALSRRSGGEVWRNESLKFRSLSAPVVVGDHVAVADFEGYVHWFDRATGEAAGRAKTSGDRINNAPLVVDDVLYVISDKGDISALRAAPVVARNRGRDAAPAEPAGQPAGG